MSDVISPLRSWQALNSSDQIIWVGSIEIRTLFSVLDWSARGSRAEIELQFHFLNWPISEVYNPKD